jgi:hypothetical protein
LRLNHNRSKWKDTKLLRTDPGVKKYRSSSVKYGHVFLLGITTFFGLKRPSSGHHYKNFKIVTIQCKLLVCTVLYLVWRWSFFWPEKNELFLNKKHYYVSQNFCNLFEVHKYSGMSYVKKHWSDDFVKYPLCYVVLAYSSSQIIPENSDALTITNRASYIQNVPGGTCQTSGECSLC